MARSGQGGELMDQKLTLTALIALAVGGSAGVLIKGNYLPVVIVAEAGVEEVELKTADAGVLLAEAEKAGAATAIKCTTQGAGANPPGRCYCYDSDNVGRGWLTDASECKGDVTITDGKVYVQGDVAEVVPK